MLLSVFTHRQLLYGWVERDRNSVPKYRLACNMRRDTKNCYIRSINPKRLTVAMYSPTSAVGILISWHAIGNEKSRLS